MDAARRYATGYVGRDQLTGFGLYRRLRRDLQRDLARGKAGAVIMCDLDNLSPFNHANDHVLGDELLRLVAAVLTFSTETDRGRGWEQRCYRMGGDDFFIRLPGADAQTAVQLADDARVKIKRLPSVLGASVYDYQGVPAPLTARFAVSGWSEGQTPKYDRLMRALDNALLQPPVRDSVVTVTLDDLEQHDADPTSR